MSKQLRNALIPLSVTNDPVEVLDEWNQITHIPRDDDIIEHCVCGVKIKEVFEIYNPLTQNTANVGCICIKRINKPEWTNFVNDALYEQKTGNKAVRCIECKKRMSGKLDDGSPKMHKSCARRRRIDSCLYCEEPILDKESHIACSIEIKKQAILRRTFPFGKYKHERIYDILKTPKGISYCKWLKTCDWVHESLKQDIREISSILYLDLTVLPF